MSRAKSTRPSISCCFLITICKLINVGDTYWVSSSHCSAPKASHLRLDSISEQVYIPGSAPDCWQKTKDLLAVLFSWVVFLATFASHDFIVAWRAPNYSATSTITIHHDQMCVCRKEYSKGHTSLCTIFCSSIKKTVKTVMTERSSTSWFINRRMHCS